MTGSVRVPRVVKVDGVASSSRKDVLEEGWMEMVRGVAGEPRTKRAQGTALL